MRLASRSVAAVLERSAGRGRGRRGRGGRSRHLAVLVAVLALAALAAACGGPAGSGPSPSSLHGPPYKIDVAEVGGLGRALVNGKGFTLYLFVPDDHSSHSRCSGICAVEWPPVVLPKGVTQPIAGPGVKRSLLGTTRRSDGSLQVTYAGWPLYRWFTDTSPGQDNGQGLNNLGGLWYVVSPSGHPIH